MAVASFDENDIPGVYVMDRSYVATADSDTTAGGKERRDVVRVRRVWDIRTRPMLAATATVIQDYLEGILWAYGDWWIDDFGATSNTIRARIDESSWRNERLLEPNGYRALAFRVIEQ